jgi:hypothetical protein
VNLTPLLTWLQNTTVATTIANSLYLLAVLSALHLVGFTLLMGSALVGNLRLVGVVLATLPVASVMAPTRRAIAVGLGMSVTTGLLLFSTRANGAAHNWIFELKMALLVTAAAFHFIVQSRFGRAGNTASAAQGVVGFVGLLLWISVALAGCAFIFLE